jgi:hypothetical protein
MYWLQGNSQHCIGVEAAERWEAVEGFCNMSLAELMAKF